MDNIEVSIPFQWKRVKFGSEPIQLFAGRARIASVYYDGTRTQGDPKAYAATMYMPGMKDQLSERYVTEQEAMEVIESATKHWLLKVLSKEGEDGK